MRKLWHAPLRAWLIAGLLVWVPLVATWLVVKLLVETLDRSLVLLPAPLRPENLFGVELPGLGILISVIVVLGTGGLVANFAGQRLLGWGEKALGRIPLVKSVYGGVKSLTEAVMSDGSQTFRKVVLIEYPNDGIWTVAFQTADPAKSVRASLGEVITVYVPTTPNPTSGFVVFVTPDKVRPLDMSVEDALKLVMTLGVVHSGNGRTPPAATEEPARRDGKPESTHPALD
ncbi:MAG: DUF502 domain-containing protein [Oceanococcaceae bacterium]